ncbi:MAG: hypothetical protein JSV65_07720 [Armatimonadota bacterium]|nr:MAG: hypothetical protein JSV65_07720 [Armatimonadota bacterium]
MGEKRARSVLRILASVAEGAVVTSVAACAVVLLLTYPLFRLAMSLPGVTDGLQAIWVLVLIPLAALAGALMGAVVFALRPRRVFPIPLLLVAVLAVAVDFALGAISSSAFPSFSMAVAALFVPAASAAGLYAVFSRRTSKGILVSRIVIVSIIVIGAGIALAYKTATHRAGFDLVRGMAVTRSARICLATDSGILAADAAALKWRLLPPVPDAQYIRDIFTDASRPNALLACVGSVKGGQLWEYDWRRNTWDLVPGINGEFDSGSTATNSHGFYVVDSFGSLHVRRADRGGQWETHAISLDGGQGGVLLDHIAVNPENPAEVLGGFSYGYGDQLLITPDYGASWREISLPRSEEEISPGGIQAVAYLPGSPPVMLVVRHQELLASRNGGATWRALKTPADPALFEALLAVSPADPPMLYLLAESILYATQDLARTWRDTGVVGMDDPGIVVDVVPDPGHPETVYVATSGVLDRSQERGNALYQSTDSGHSWRRIRWDWREASRQP